MELHLKRLVNAHHRNNTSNINFINPMRILFCNARYERVRDMSKKSERISYLVGIRNAINQPDATESAPDVSNNYVYTKKKIQGVLATVDHLVA